TAPGVTRCTPGGLRPWPCTCCSWRRPESTCRERSSPGSVTWRASSGRCDVLNALFGELSAVASHRGWPRAPVNAGTWRGIGEALREGKLDLLGEWGDAAAVHCALFEPATRKLQIATHEAGSGAAPSLAVFHPPALRLERAIADLFAIEMVGLPRSEERRVGKEGRSAGARRV